MRAEGKGAGDVLRGIRFFAGGKKNKAKGQIYR